MGEEKTKPRGEQGEGSEYEQKEAELGVAVSAATPSRRVASPSFVRVAWPPNGHLGN